MTRSTWIVALAATALIWAGWALGYAEMAGVGATGILCVLTSWGWTISATRVDVAQTLDRPGVERGEPAAAAVEITNRAGRRTPSFLAEEPCGARVETILVPRLRAGETRSVVMPLPTDTRGVIKVGPLRVTRRDPFGLVSSTRTTGPSHELWVYPRTHRLGAIPAGLARDVEGPTSDTSPEGSITFHALREYVRGDDLRRIHWRSSARTGTLMVRQYVDTSRPDTVIVLDTRGIVHSDESFEAAVDAAASLARACCENNFPVRLHTTCGLSVDGARLAAPYRHLLETLAVVQRSDEERTRALVDGLRMSSGGTALAVMGGRVEPEDVESFATLRRRFRRIVLVSFAERASGDRTAVLPGMSFLQADDCEDFASQWMRAVG